MNQEQPKGPSVLLMDDDRFLLDMYGMKFGKEGYTVQSCLTVDEALQTLRGGYRPDAVVFDLVMPQTDGFAFLKKIHEEKLCEDSALIALTNQSGEGDRKDVEQLGIDHYIVKASMIPSEVVHTVGEAIAKHRKA